MVASPHAPPAVTARRAYIQSGLELDEDCGSDVFYYFLAMRICRETEGEGAGPELSGGS